MQKFHNLDSPCMHSGSHIIKPVIYEKQKPFVYLLEQKLAIAWSHPRAIHEYTSISFRSARLCHGTVIFITVSLEQTCFKGCLMSLKHNLQGQLGPVPVARESLFSTTNSIQIRSQSRSSLHGLFTQGWAPREFCTPESVGVHVQQSHGFLLPQPKTCWNNCCIGTRLYFLYSAYQTLLYIIFTQKEMRSLADLCSQTVLVNY